MRMPPMPRIMDTCVGIYKYCYLVWLSPHAVLGSNSYVFRYSKLGVADAVLECDPNRTIPD